MEAEIPRLRRYARFVVGDAERADDLVQDCLTRAIGSLGTWQPGTNLRAWLFVILRNCFLNEVRRARRAPVVDGELAIAVAVPGRQEDHVAVIEVRRALAGLSKDHREVLVLVALEGLAYEEAAAILGVPVGTVRSRASRARQALRDALAEPPADAGARNGVAVKE